MPKFRVHFEASAAIGIEIEVEAEDSDAAQAVAESQFNRNDVAENLFRLVDIDEHARKGFADAMKISIPYACVSPDESGFEVVDVFEPELLKEAAA